MIVYRITTKKWATTLQASGYPARWNSAGVYMLYSAESISLACLENLVHRNGIGSNLLFEVMHIEIPNSLEIREIDLDSLPIGWDDLGEEGYQKCRVIGDQWMKSGISVGLRVPSVIIPNEFNVLINTQHKDFSKLKIKSHHAFSFDKRLK